jgi:hypothetical protein
VCSKSTLNYPLLQTMVKDQPRVARTDHVFKDEEQLMVFHRHLLQLHYVRVN